MTGHESSVNDDDARDVAAAKTGDHRAFARLYDRHAPVVLSLCRQHMRSVADADDACQETFIRAFGMLHRLERGSLDGNGDGVRSWMYAIARRVCSERRRASSRRIRHEGDAVRESALLLSQRERLVPGSESLGFGADELDRLTLALDELDDRERLAVHLYYLDADHLRAAHQALGLSRSGYYKLLARARDKLAALMTGQASRHRGNKASRD